MRVGIDVTSWANGRGYGRFTRGLVPALLAANEAAGGPHELVALLDAGADGRGDLELPALPEGLARVVAGTAEAATRAASSGGRRALRDLWAMRAAAGQVGLDVLLYPTVYTYFPPPARVPALVTIHDVIPERFPRLVFPNRRPELFWRLKVGAATRRAALVLTVSRDAARGIARRLRVHPARIRVVGEAPDPRFRPPDGLSREAAARVLARLGLAAGTPYLLYVGGLSPHKNLAALAEAVGRLRRDPAHAALRLVLAGDYAGDSFFSAYPTLRRLVAERGLEGVVVFAGFVPDDDLVGLYQAARALVLPSLGEGFGLPAVEALACGTPVVTSTVGSLPEVVGEAGLFFDPLDAAGLDWALRRVLGDDGLRADLAARGPARARSFSWERTARLTLAALEEAWGARDAAKLPRSVVRRLYGPVEIDGTGETERI
jgi:glycosyltransferase involved in cell wall biosynthesis